MGYQKLTPIIATGSSAPRYLGDRFADIVNVKDFGAAGDGTTDDTASFTAAAATSRYVFVPGGTYKLTEDVSGSFFCFEDVSITGTNGAVNGATTLYGIPADMVNRHGAQTISGAKSFQDEITVKSEEVVHVPNSAAAHNAIYRGKDLTSEYTLEEISAKLALGDFSDFFIGDYITKTFTNPSNDSETMDFLFAGFNYYKHKGGGGTYTQKQGYTITEFECDFNHILMVPRDCFVENVQMNSSNTTAGAYLGSAMNTLCKTYATNLGASGVFGDYIKVFSFWESPKVDTNVECAGYGSWTGAHMWFNDSKTGYDWACHKVRLMTEVMVYGSNVFSSSGFDSGSAPCQLPLFALNPELIVARSGLGGERNSYWLSNVASSQNFAGVYFDGHTSYYNASSSRGVRPFFLIA